MNIFWIFSTYIILDDVIGLEERVYEIRDFLSRQYSPNESEFAL